MESILIQANAKINLDFKILGRRRDGYHLIESVFQSIDLSDFLKLEKSKKDNFTGAIICPEEKNIVYKAKKILERNVGRKLPAIIHLQKSIPISSGLGGGSADAAATLLGLNMLYSLNLSQKELAEMGIKIGADVPFFLYGGTCRVEGIGERIKKIKQKPASFYILFRPHKRLETKMMYKLYDKTGKDFLALAKEFCPDIKTIEKKFQSLNLKMKLSGSGPTVFCRTNNYNLAKKVTESYPEFNGDIFICHPQKEGLKIWKT